MEYEETIICYQDCLQGKVRLSTKIADVKGETDKAKTAKETKELKTKKKWIHVAWTKKIHFEFVNVMLGW